MQQSHFERYLSDLYELEITEMDDYDEVIKGRLIPKNGNKNAIDIVRAIPRFVFSNNYADNFGLQWNKFKSTQLDSSTGLPLTANRFWSNTKWEPEKLFGKTILEVGCGAGRFTEVLLQAGATVVSFDYSNAVDVNFENNSKKGDLFVFQGDIYDIPFPDGYFDYVFCYGVLQHTPDPIKAYKAIFTKLRSGGRISIDYYRKMKKPSPWSTPKYVWRPITSKMNPEKLLKIVQWYIPFYLPVDTVIRKIPKIGFLFAALIPIPCWSINAAGLSRKQRLEWAIMDTFDALGAAYDIPKTLEEVKGMVESHENEELDVFYGSNGIVANVVKR
ncbi:MAG: class I SAM-dependent methyltransferase [Desulfosalsimonadaceae bacterium]